MQEKKSFPLSKQDMIMLIMLAVVLLGIYVFSFWPLFPVMNSPKTPNWLFGPMGLLALLGFGVVWSLAMKLLFKNHPRLKIATISLGITLSAIFLSWWIIEKTSLLNHMFG